MLYSCTVPPLHHLGTVPHTQGTAVDVQCGHPAAATELPGGGN